MTRARGQASRSLINRELPHRVLVRAEDTRGRALDAVYAFHDNRGVPVRSHSLRKDDEWYLVYSSPAEEWLRGSISCLADNYSMR
jgi:hypothetical protein